MPMRAIAFLTVQGAIFAAFGWMFFDALGVVIALAIAVVVSFWTFWSGAEAILRATGAREMTDADTIALVAELSTRAGLPTPRVFVIEDEQANAFTLGANPEQAVLVVTTSLQRCLTREELAAAVMHELGHVRTGDTLSATLGVTLLTAISELALLLGLLGVLLRRNGGGMLIALAILAPLLALVAHMAAGRSREYAADRFAAELVGADHIIAALKKLDIWSRESVSTIAFNQPALAALFIVDPLPQSWLGRVFATHPPTQKRINRLLAMANVEEAK